MMKGKNIFLTMGLVALSLGGLYSADTPAAKDTPAQPTEQKDSSSVEVIYILPPLPYAYDALEPYIDAATMRLHHDKHHAAYVKGANEASRNLKEIAEGKRDASETTHWVRQLAFHGSGHAMHSIFWKNMTPTPKAAPEGSLATAIKDSFGSYANFLKLFKAASAGVEGSGWGVLGYEPLSKKLVVLGVEKHQNLSVMGIVPLLVCDVWEHAYYLKHQNNRAAYVDDFLHVVNWNDVEQRYDNALKLPADKK